MSMAMQGMVDEIIRERQGKGIRQVSDFVNPFEINALVSWSNQSIDLLKKIK